MRLILELDAPTAGDVTVNGKHYRDHAAPLHEVGALLEARSVHTGRSAYNHLLALAQTHGIPKSRVDELIDLVGLHEVAKKRAGQFSLGMGQRLGIATALLGDPATVLLDEPVNGLDPEGILWMRHLLKGLAAEGRTVFVSSHLMSEMALTADHLIVIGRGRLIADTSTEDFVQQASGNVVRVRSPQAARLAELLAGPEVTVTSLDGDGLLDVKGLKAGADRRRRSRRTASRSMSSRRSRPRSRTPSWSSPARTSSSRRRSSSPGRSRERRRRTARPRHAGARRALGVDEAPLGPLDPLVVPRRGRLRDRDRGARLHRGRAPLPADGSAREGELRRARGQPRRRTARPARDRRPRRARDHGRVLDRDDQGLDDRRPEAPARAVGQGDGLRRGDGGADDPGGADRVLRRPGDPLAPPHQHRVHAPGRPARRDRRRPLPGRRRACSRSAWGRSCGTPRAGSRSSRGSCS